MSKSGQSSSSVSSPPRISVSEFKATCLDLFEQIYRKGKVFTITKKGQDIAEVHPIKSHRSTRFGALKGLMEIKGDIVHMDYSDDWEVLK